MANDKNFVVKNGLEVGQGITANTVTANTISGALTGTANNATNLNGQAASYYLNFNNFTNVPTYDNFNSVEFGTALMSAPTFPIAVTVQTNALSNDGVYFGGSFGIVANVYSTGLYSTNSTSTSSTIVDLSLDLDTLITSTSDGDGDYFVVVDTSGNQRKLTKGNINISGFNNDAGYTTNIGDITGVSAGSGLTGGGTSGSVTLSHADTSTVVNLLPSSRTYVTGLTFDGFGHVTGFSTGTETVVNTDTNTTYNLLSPGSGVLRLQDSSNANDNITFTGSGATSVSSNATHIVISSTDNNTTYSNGAGIGLSGTTFSHLDTSSQASLTALTGANVVSDIDLDGFGHVTNLATRTMTLANLGYTGATNADNYGGWNIFTQGTARDLIQSAGNVDFFGGTGISTSYSNSGSPDFINRVTFTLTDNGVTAEQLNVSGNGTAGQALLSNGDGSFSWGDAGASVHVSTGAPDGPSSGDLWWDSDIGVLMIYYNDGTSSQWVEASPNPNPFTYDAGTSTYTLTGNLTVTGDLNSNSDESLKQNINTFEGGLAAVKSMRGVRYEWKESGKSSIGLIAQEVEKILPELVATGEDDIKSIQYGNIVAVLIEAVKELSARVEELENK